MTSIDQIKQQTKSYLNSSILPALKEFVTIPNLSRYYDPNWATNGLLEKASKLCIDWANSQNVKGLSVKLYTEPDRTPFIFGEIAATKPSPAKTIVAYGHIDKMPHLTESWSEGLHPTIPTIKNGKLYGRGSNDDGYAFFTAVSLAKISQDCEIPHDRIVLFFECDEESSSIDLEYYLEKFSDQIGNPDIFMCLDSCVPDYNHFSVTSSLRGYIEGILKVEVCKEATHSGGGGGILPDNFRIIRNLLSRIENVETGEVIQEFQTPFPVDKEQFAKTFDKVFGFDHSSWMSFQDGVQHMGQSSYEDYVNNHWKAQQTILGQEGLPALKDAGCILRPSTSVKFSLRCPPDFDVKSGTEKMKQILEANPPYNAKVTANMEEHGHGFSCKKMDEDWLLKLNEVGQEIWGQETVFFGVGGSIPFVTTIAEKYPDTKMLVTGAAGPGSNAHGPNENLDLGYFEKFLSAMVLLLSK